MNSTVKNFFVHLDKETIRVRKIGRGMLDNEYIWWDSSEATVIDMISLSVIASIFSLANPSIIIVYPHTNDINNQGNLSRH